MNLPVADLKNLIQWFDTFEKALDDSELEEDQIMDHLNRATECLKDVPATEDIETIVTVSQNIMEKYMKGGSPRKDENEEKYDQAIDDCKQAPRVKGFVDIAGYTQVKTQLKMMVVLPLRQPQLYNGHKMFNSVLLYGPPGTGKTQFAHAVAAEAKADLYCISPSSVLNSYFGETEKMISAIFTSMKTVTKTSILFIDEIDGLCRKRKDSEHDNTRRLKTELMCQLSNFEDYKKAFLICATNCPWDLDTAFLRRFQKRIHIPLPSRFERKEILKYFTDKTALKGTSLFWDNLLDSTNGYTGSDLNALVRHAMMRPIIELQDIKVWKYTSGVYFPLSTHVEGFSADLRFCSLDELPDGSIRSRQVVLKDLYEAAKCVKSTIPPSEIARFNNYTKNC